ncbi:transposase zinc-binding domain-containing protein [Salmonella enterica subsp. enterica serovar Thompson]|nr:transposase zinc-binding domain-containing protein [Salmonella enterica]
MYIPRPAKLLFTVDDGWNRYLEKHGDSISDWTRLAVERMLACGTCAMGVRRYCCASPDCTHSRFFCQSCKSKACSACGMKSTEQWIAEQQHVLPDCEWQHTPLPYHTCCGPSSTTTGPCSTTCSAAPPGLC